ncbi:MAG: nitroreductase family protein [Syntrophobacteraceae bacterium]
MKSVEMEAKQDKAEFMRELEGNFTETEKVILRRRSTRWYKKEQVPEFMIKRILEAGRFAPSAGNCQPWKFAVIRDPKIIGDLTEHVVKGCKAFKSLLDYRAPGKFWKLPLAKMFIRFMPKKLHPVPFGAISLIADGRLGVFHGAPSVILIFKDVRGVTNPDLDCGIAGQNMVLAAHSMGLGTCWVSFSSLIFDYQGSKWKKFFGVRYPYKFVSSLAIGWPKGSPDGFVARPPHSVDWFENGEKQVLDAGGRDSKIGIGERLSIPNYKNPSQIRMGEVAFDHEKCTGCGECGRICPADSIRIQNKKPFMTESAECIACGDCMAICPKEAIRLRAGYRFSKHYKTIDHSGLNLPRLK